MIVQDDGAHGAHRRASPAPGAALLVNEIHREKPRSFYNDPTLEQHRKIVFVSGKMQGRRKKGLRVPRSKVQMFDFNPEPRTENLSTLARNYFVKSQCRFDRTL
jgi:hypothetical protein